MTVVIYIRSLLKGGAEKQAVLLCNELQKYHKTYLVVHDMSEGTHQDITNISNLIVLKGKSNFAKSLTLYRLLKKKEVSHLFTYLPVNNIIGGIVGKIARVKSIYCGIRGEKKKRFLKHQIQKALCNNLNIKFISNSHKAKSKYVSYGFKSNNIIVIHNSIEQNLVQSTDGSIRHKRIVWMGRFVPEKDIFTFLKAISILKNSNSSVGFKVLIVGYGPLEKEIIEYLNQNELSDLIEIQDGRNVNIKTLFTAKDIFVLTSKFEGMPNTIMEAMSMGLPVIGTDVGDVKYLIKEEYNGYIIDIGDYNKIAKRIEQLLEDDRTFKKFQENSLLKIRKEFSIEKMTNSYLTLIDGR